MRLKLLTTAALVLGFALLLLGPTVLRQRPRPIGYHTPLRREIEAFEIIFAGYVGMSACAFMGAGCLAALMMRSAREEYARQAIANIQDLVEGSIQDLRSRPRPGQKS